MGQCYNEKKKKENIQIAVVLIQFVGEFQCAAPSLNLLLIHIGEVHIHEQSSAIIVCA